jgi:hypothetical protein
MSESPYLNPDYSPAQPFGVSAHLESGARRTVIGTPFATGSGHVAVPIGYQYEDQRVTTWDASPVVLTEAELAVLVAGLEAARQHAEQVANGQL